MAIPSPVSLSRIAVDQYQTDSSLAGHPEKNDHIVEQAAASHDPANHSKNEVEQSNEQHYKVLELPSRTPRHLKVITIGAGISALNFAHEVSISDLDVELTCYEKNPEIGGTWYENRYPGCACDIPAVNYQLSWAPWIWSSYYSAAPEILAYLKDVAEKHDLRKYVRLRSRVVDACWSASDHQWLVKVEKLDTGEIISDQCHVLINASGVLNSWKWPAIKGRESFKGTIIHSAKWDRAVDLKGKRVAVIGGGSSGVQIVPNIQPEVGSMKCFIRSSSWVTAGFGQRFAGKDGRNFLYSDTQREIFRNDPVKYLKYRKNIESELNARFKFILNGSAEQAAARNLAEIDMKKRLARKPGIADILVPKNYPVGCRRPTPGNGYLEALCEDNVQVVNTSISEFTPTGIRTTDGLNHEFDVMICATGFDVSWRPPYRIMGRNGKRLSKEWEKTPSTYLSITVPDFPNYLIFNGPFGPYGHGSFIPIAETIGRHFMKMLRKMSEERISSFAPTKKAVDDFAEHRRAFLPRTSWTSPCRSWFKQGTVDGEPMMWPGSRIHFFETMEHVRWEDYEIEHMDSNRFAYLANGFASREYDGRDLSWYLGLLDNEQDIQPEFVDDDVAEFLTS